MSADRVVAPTDTISRAVFVEIVNSTVDDIGGTVSLSEAMQDLCNLFVNVAVTRFDDPGKSLTDCIVENYETEAEEVLGWVGL